jgi:hypothetical protein
LAPPVTFGSISVASGPSHLLHDRRREDRPQLEARRQLLPLGLQRRREVDQIVEADTLALDTPAAW